MNKVFLVGRLTRDFDLRYGANNTAVARTSIAVDRQFSNQNGEREADFINIVAFGNRAETMKKYLTKGSQIAISGRIQTGSYDASDGRKVYTTDIVIEEFQFLDSKGSRQVENNNTNVNSTNDVTPYDFATESPSTNAETDPFKDFGDKIEIDDSDLPF
mgnify:FL=1